MKSLTTKPKGVLVFVDDNRFSQKIVKRCLKDLKLDNQLVCCYNGEEALSYLKDTNDKIFMIMSEVTMPKMDGLELKRVIEMTPELKMKAIPFFYFTEVDLDAVVKVAYSLGIQGYFKKSTDAEKVVRTLTCIFELWTHCIHPKDVK